MNEFTLEEEICLPWKLTSTMELCVIIGVFMCQRDLVTMYLHQRQQGPQPLLYSLSFSLKWGLYLYLQLSAKCYHNSLWEYTCQRAPAAEEESSLCPFVPDSIKNSLSPSVLLSTTNPNSWFLPSAPHLTTMSLHFTDSSTPHISCYIQYRVFLLTPVFTCRQGVKT